MLFILYYDQQMHNYFTNYHTATCFDTTKNDEKILSIFVKENPSQNIFSDMRGRVVAEENCKRFTMNKT